VELGELNPTLGFSGGENCGKSANFCHQKNQVLCGSTMLSTDVRLGLTPSVVKKLRIDICCENFVLNLFENCCLLR
jgi:hypothetical protein